MDYPYFCTLVPQASTFKLLATKCYRHADTSRPIPFNSPWRVDSNQTLSDSCGHLPTEVSASFSILTSTAMRMLRNLHHSIPPERWIPTHPVLILSDHWLKVIHTFILSFSGQVLSHCWLLSARGIQTLRDLYHSITLAGWIPMGPFPTLADICSLRYLSFSSC